MEGIFAQTQVREVAGYKGRWRYKGRRQDYDGHREASIVGQTAGIMFGSELFDTWADEHQL